MPDANELEKGSESVSPASWGEAFAILPQEAPDAGGWQRVQARMPVSSPRVRRRWPLWLAAAASLGLVVALPLRISREAAVDSPAAATAQRTVEQPSAPATPKQPDILLAPRSQGLRDGIATEDRGVAMPPRARTGKHSTPQRDAPAQHPIRSMAEPAGATRLADSDAAAQPIESLYAESAQLERLLAMARDERVASGASAALSSGLDDRVAGIDAALAQPDLDAADRDRLWRQRVDAMQQLVGIETTRMLSARGDAFNASLVSID